MEIQVYADRWLVYDDRTLPCALGAGGVTADKREGDKATPVGRFPLRRVLFRPDRVTRPATDLPVAPMAPDDGWCDDPDDRLYNQPVKRPYAASHESLWRDDHVYDVILVLGHNDAPPVPGAGSAIFLHVARDGFRPTEGCVALRLDDVLALLARCGPSDAIRIHAEPLQGN